MRHSPHHEVFAPSSNPENEVNSAPIRPGGVPDNVNQIVTELNSKVDEQAETIRQLQLEIAAPREPERLE